MSSIVSRSNEISDSNTRCSGKVGSAGCVVFPALRKVSQDAMHLIVDVAVCRLPADRHHLRMLLLVPTSPRRLDNLPI
jgi:hypothetical protein